MNYYGFGIDKVYFDKIKGECYLYKTSIKGEPTKFVGVNIRLGFIFLRFGKKNRLLH